MTTRYGVLFVGLKRELWYTFCTAVLYAICIIGLCYTATLLYEQYPYYRFSQSYKFFFTAEKR